MQIEIGSSKTLFFGGRRERKGVEPGEITITSRRPHNRTGISRNTMVKAGGPEWGGETAKRHRSAVSEPDLQVIGSVPKPH
jgi:hypothetical protein